MGVNSCMLTRGEKFRGGPLASDVVAQLNRRLNYPESGASAVSHSSSTPAARASRMLERMVGTSSASTSSASTSSASSTGIGASTGAGENRTPAITNAAAHAVTHVVADTNEWIRARWGRRGERLLHTDPNAFK